MTISGYNKKKNVAIKGKFQSAGATTLLKSTILNFRTSAESLVHESTLLWLQVQVVFIFRASPIFSDMLTSSWRATFFSKTTFLVKVTTSFCDENLILWRFVEKKERKSDVFRHNELVFQTNKCFRKIFFEQIKKSFWSRTKKMCFLRFNFFPQRRQAVSDCRPPYLRLFIRELSEQEKNCATRLKLQNWAFKRLGLKTPSYYFGKVKTFPSRRAGFHKFSKMFGLAKKISARITQSLLNAKPVRISPPEKLINGDIGGCFHLLNFSTTRPLFFLVNLKSYQRRAKFWTAATPTRKFERRKRSWEWVDNFGVSFFLERKAGATENVRKKQVWQSCEIQSGRYFTTI